MSLKILQQNLFVVNVQFLLDIYGDGYGDSPALLSVALLSSPSLHQAHPVNLGIITRILA